VVIYDVLGRKVADLVTYNQTTGTHSVLWDGLDRYGSEVASGVYLYRILTGNFSETKRMVLMK